MLVDSKQMLEVVNTKIAKKGITNSKTLLSDFTKSTSELKADIVLMSLVLLHIPYTKNILQELFSILNNDGKLIIVDFDKTIKLITQCFINYIQANVLSTLLIVLPVTGVGIASIFYNSNKINQMKNNISQSGQIL